MKLLEAQEVLDEGGRLERVEKLVAEGQSIDPGSGRALRLRGGIALARGRTRRALRFLLRAARDLGDDYRTHELLLRSYAALGRSGHPTLERHFLIVARAGTKRPAGLVGRAWLAWSRARQARGALRARLLDEARRLCDRALEARPSMIWAHEVRMRVHQERGDAPGALADADALVRLAGWAWAHFRRAQTLWKFGRLQEALSSFDRAIALDGAYGAAYYNRGLLLYRLGEYRRAVADLDEGLRLGWKALPARPYLFRAKARLRLGEKKGALEDFDRALARHPVDVEALTNRGMLLWESGRRAEADRDFTRALGLVKGTGLDKQVRKFVRGVRGF